MVHVVQYCCHSGKDHVTAATVQRTKDILSDLHTANSRKALFDSLVREVLVKTLPRRGKVIPCIPLPESASLETELVECIGVEALGLCDRSPDFMNSAVIGAHIKDEVASLRVGSAVLAQQDSL